MTKRRLEQQRELTDFFIDILEELVDTGKLISILEVEDDKTTAIKVKKRIFKHSEDLKNYYRTVIEPIRAAIER